MIERIELKNFESHEHTVIDGLSKGLNLIHGMSNSGKTSVIRALKLVAYNEFNPRAVRTGSKNCEVTVTTHRGTVKVIRGKDNQWEVTPKGGKTQYFEKIGKNALPQASEIMGMGMVRLGDVEMPVNVMNQLEGHFMLSELAGKNATGSVRAQVIDEISGLSGIEGLIKAVSLDNHRWGREVKVLEDRIDEVRSEMHNQDELDTERKLLDQVGEILKNGNECREVSKELSDISRKAKNESDAAASISSELAGLPDVKTLSEIVNKVSSGLAKKTKAEGLYESWKSESDSLGSVKRRLKGFGPVDEVKTIVADMDKLFGRARKMSILVRERKAERRAMKEVQRALSAISGTEKASKLADKAQALSSKLGEMGKLNSEIEKLRGEFKRTKAELEKAEKEFDSLCEEHDEIICSFKVCPVCSKPIDETCMKNKGAEKNGKQD